jgi:transposase InsO family protein
MNRQEVDQDINPQSLTNREKTMLIGALKPLYRLSELLEQLEMPRSSYFYHQVRLRLPEKYTALRQTITEVFDANDKRDGYRRVHLMLRREGVQVSEKVVRRIMTEESLVVSWTIGTIPDAELVNTMLDSAIAGIPDGQRPTVILIEGATIGGRGGSHARKKIA